MNHRISVLGIVVAVFCGLSAAVPVRAAKGQPARAWRLVATPEVNELTSDSSTVPYTSFGGPLGSYTQDITSTWTSGAFSYEVSFEFVRSPEWRARDAMSARGTPSLVKGRGGAEFTWTVPPPTVAADGEVEMTVTVTHKPQEFVKEPEESDTSWLPMAIPTDPSRRAVLTISTSRGYAGAGLSVRDAGTKSVRLTPPPPNAATTWEITVAASAFGRASIVYRYELGVAEDEPHAGKLPCEQAIQVYGLSRKPTGMRFNADDLRRQFDEAITRWERETKRKVFIGAPRTGTLPALGWLGNQGGLTDEINKQFVLTTEADRQRIKDGHYRDDAVPWGTERRLYLEIAAESDRLQRKLTPGELFFLALQQRDGDALEASLLAHNTLRTLARVSANPIHGKGDLDYTMVRHDEQFIQDRLQPLIDEPPLGRGQNTGAWYHLFGVAYFEMHSRSHRAVSSAVL